MDLLLSHFVFSFFCFFLMIRRPPRSTLFPYTSSSDLYLTHATHHDPRKYPALYFAFWGMTGLLVFTFLFAGLHTLAWLPRSLQYRKMLQASHALDSPVHVRRFPKLYRNLHIMVISSFLALALTGMALKFSYTPWAYRSEE